MTENREGNDFGIQGGDKSGYGQQHVGEGYYRGRGGNYSGNRGGRGGSYSRGENFDRETAPNSQYNNMQNKGNNYQESGYQMPQSSQPNDYNNRQNN